MKSAKDIFIVYKRKTSGGSIAEKVFLDEQASAALYAATLEIIGEDEHDKTMDITYQEWRNELRHEQRIKAKKFYGVEG